MTWADAVDDMLENWISTKEKWDKGLVESPAENQILMHGSCGDRNLLFPRLAKALKGYTAVHAEINEDEETTLITYQQD